ncbi:MAG TPA: plasmid pRiA4b ORF-3 family protein [Armatimonadota bacterium]|jgi:hypothetical protein
MAASAEPIYQLKITLVGIRPPVWRRVQTEAGITLGKLHGVIQAAMGWTDSHMHGFDVRGVSYGQPIPDLDSDLEMKSETRMKLRQAAPKERSRFRYEYDFGDSWQHDILLEKIVPAEPGVRYPVCVGGRRACPPEDCGGVWGYADLLGKLADPESEEREDLLEWLGGEIDPEHFDLEEVNRSLAHLR